MANGFPQRSAYGAGAMTAGGAGAQQLDGPPPSPVMPQGGMPQMGGQTPQMPSFGEMAQPMTAGTLGRAVAPEIAAGILQSAQVIAGMFDSIASVVPDLATDMALQKDLLMRAMGKLFENSGVSGAPGSTGLNFPGGGFAGGSM